MSEVWLSRKKWTCKYCDVTINDDVPSRQQHENGLRHKGNVERSLRQAYKKSERDRKEDRDAKREMEKIERLAQQSFAQDLASGSQSMNASSKQAPAEPSKPTREETKGKVVPAWKPTNRLAAYGSALPLQGGDTAENEEKVLNEWQERQEARRKEGTAGQWESVIPAASAAASQIEAQPSVSVPRERATSYVVREKQGHFRQDDDDEVAAEIKVKKRSRGYGEAEKQRQAEEEKRKMVPAWTPVRLDAAGTAKKEKMEITPFARGESQDAESAAAEEEEEEESKVKLKEEEERSEMGEGKMPEHFIPPTTAPPLEAEAPSSSLFKKRKAGAGAGAKRVRAVI